MSTRQSASPLFFHYNFYLAEMFAMDDKEFVCSLKCRYRFETIIVNATTQITVTHVFTIIITDIPKLSQHNKVLRKASKTTISQEDINELLEPPSVFEKLCRGPLKVSKYRIIYDNIFQIGYIQFLSLISLSFH